MCRYTISLEFQGHFKEMTIKMFHTLLLYYIIYYSTPSITICRTVVREYWSIQYSRIQ